MTAIRGEEPVARPAPNTFRDQAMKNHRQDSKTADGFSDVGPDLVASGSLNMLTAVFDVTADSLCGFTG